MNDSGHIALIDRLRALQAVLSKLPDRLTPEQKRRKVHNLLQELRPSASAVNQGTRSHPEWISVEARDN